ncbi:hypothetical protein M885DRAFT_512722 [Pelagophyceae sp. CCMP2097]|nr:hypothetical protein M885DRAFT_512722 [Pelagophyceae sp. CCMP2097]
MTSPAAAPTGRGPRRKAPTALELSTVAALGGRIRNMCVLGHVDHGKSSLVDWLIAENGIIPARLAGQLRFLDDTADEQARGITMRASAITVVYTHAGLSPKWDLAAAEDKRYSVTLVDSPGHIDFSSDATAATRLCDGCVIVVDAVEGLRIQSHAALRNACAERSRPVLVLNKLDRLLQTEAGPAEAWERLRRLIESANASVFGALTALMPDADEAERDALADEWKFSPQQGNVVFASALDGWGFTLAQAAGVLAPKLNVPRKKLVDVLFGDFAYGDGKVLKWARGSAREPLFADLVLAPIWAAYGAASRGENLKAVADEHHLFGAPDSTLKPLPDDLTDARQFLRRRFPVAAAVLRAVVLTVPPPAVAQAQRLSVLLSPGAERADAAAARAIADCDGTLEAPTVLYVSKLALLQDSKVYAFCRVFSGVVTVGDELTVVKDGVVNADGSAATATVVVRGVFAMMGSSVVSLHSARAGQIVALGPEVAQAMRCKRATLVRGGGVPLSLAPPRTRFAQQPVVRVAVDVVRQADAAALDDGLVLLDQLSGSASVEVAANGERIVGAVGELHLDQCLKDLRELYARCDLRVSKPIVGFREGCFEEDGGGRPPQADVAPWSDEFDPESAVRCVAMPRALARALNEAPRQDQAQKSAARTAVELALAASADAREALADHKTLSALLPQHAVGVGPDAARGCALILNAAAVELLDRGVLAAIVAGFELACIAGPLADEPMHAVVFVVHDVESLIRDDPQAPPRGHGAIMVATKKACRAALLAKKVQLYEASLECELHCGADHLGHMYGLLSKRRGKVLGEDMVEGTDLFVVRAAVPARDALGFGAELLQWTSGAATAPQLRFDDFEPVAEDPFWRPRTLEEREEHGEAFVNDNYARRFINEVRTRKGLPTELRVLAESAEKQRSSIKG